MRLLDYVLYNAKGEPVPFTIEHCAYLVRAKEIADSQPVTVSNMLLKLGYITCIGYEYGYTKDFTRYEPAIANHAEAGFTLTERGEALLQEALKAFDSKVKHEVKRQRR